MPGREGLKALLAGSVSLVLALLLGELVVRLASPANPVGRDSRKPITGTESLPKLKGVLSLARPNVRGIFNGVVHQTNSAGFRGREYSLEKPANAFRVVVIGDSVTMGSGVEGSNVYSSVLEQRLNEEREDRNYEVLNLGISGLDLKTSVQARLEKIGLKFDPDLLVYGFTLNDLEGPAYIKVARGHGGKRVPRYTPGESRLLELIRVRWRYLRELIYPPADSYVYELDKNYFDNPAAWNEFETALESFAAIARNLDVCGVVLLHTALHSLGSLHPYTRHYQKVRNTAEANGLFVIDPFDAFKGHRAKTLWVHPFDSHPNVRGHAILAGELEKGLDTLPERCWQRRSEAPGERPL